MRHLNHEPQTSMKIRGKNGQNVISEKNINCWITLTEFSIICRLFFYIFQRKNECIQLGEKNNKGGTVFSIKSFCTMKIRKAFEWRPLIHETSERHLHNVRCALNSMFLKFQACVKACTYNYMPISLQKNLIILSSDVKNDPGGNCWQQKQNLAFHNRDWIIHHDLWIKFAFLRITLCDFSWNLKIKTFLLLEYLSSGQLRSFCLLYIVHKRGDHYSNSVLKELRKLIDLPKATRENVCVIKIPQNSFILYFSQSSLGSFI